jgi:D-alanyl-D-alanine carboxypeptidase/D-alanyl-D-alanine-endopeptidase (penicillin-binding protein 4)
MGRMKSHYGHWAGLLLGLALLLPGKTAQAFCRADLAERLDAIATQPDLQHSRLGILVETQEANAQVLYARDADRYFIPASNLKLLTTAAALRRLGPAFRIRTSIYGTQRQGLTTLYVAGRGDPTLTDAQLDGLAQQLAEQGITRVTNLLGGDGYFTGPAVNPNWEWEDVQADYGAPVNSLILNANAIRLTLFPQAVGQPLRLQWNDADPPWPIANTSRTVESGQLDHVNVGWSLGQTQLQVTGQLPAGAASETVDLAVPNPAETFMQRLQQALTNRGITVLQTGITTQPPPADMAELAAVTSPPPLPVARAHQS